MTETAEATALSPEGAATRRSHRLARVMLALVGLLAATALAVTLAARWAKRSEPPGGSTQFPGAASLPRSAAGRSPGQTARDNSAPQTASATPDPAAASLDPPPSSTGTVADWAALAADAPEVVALAEAYQYQDFAALARALESASWPALLGLLGVPETPMELRRLALETLVQGLPDAATLAPAGAAALALSGALDALVRDRRVALFPRGPHVTWPPGVPGLWRAASRALDELRALPAEAGVAGLPAPVAARLAVRIATELPDLADPDLQRRLADVLWTLDVSEAHVATGILRALEGAEDRELRLALIEALATQPHDEPVYAALAALATREAAPVAERAAATRALSGETARELLRQLARDSEAEVAVAALNRLAEDVGRAAGDELLFRALSRESRSPEVRAAALAAYTAALTRNLDSESVESVTAALAPYLEDPSPEVQASAVDGYAVLVRAGSAAAADRLRGLAGSRERPMLTVVRALSHLDLSKPKNRAVVRAAAGAGRRRGVRVIAFRRLATLKDATFLDLVRAYVSKAESPVVRLAALTALVDRARDNPAIRARLDDLIGLCRERLTIEADGVTKWKLSELLGRLLRLKREVEQRAG